MKKCHRILIIGIVALILIFVVSIGSSYTVFAYHGGSGDTGNPGGEWGGITPGIGPGWNPNPGWSQPPGGTGSG